MKDARRKLRSHLRYVLILSFFVLLFDFFSFSSFASDLYPVPFDTVYMGHSSYSMPSVTNGSVAQWSGNNGFLIYLSPDGVVPYGSNIIQLSGKWSTDVTPVIRINPPFAVGDTFSVLFTISCYVPDLGDSVTFSQLQYQDCAIFNMGNGLVQIYYRQDVVRSSNGWFYVTFFPIELIKLYVQQYTLGNTLTFYIRGINSYGFLVRPNDFYIDTLSILGSISDSLGGGASPVVPDGFSDTNTGITNGITNIDNFESTVFQNFDVAITDTGMESFNLSGLQAGFSLYSFIVNSLYEGTGSLYKTLITLALFCIIVPALLGITHKIHGGGG